MVYFNIKKYFYITSLTFLLISCSFLKTEEDKAIELVQESKSTELNGAKTWLDYANEIAKLEHNKKHIWIAKETDSPGVFLVAFQDEKGWGITWEATLKEKIVRQVTGDDYLSMKYGLSRFDPEQFFEISNIKVDTLKVEGEKIKQGFWESLFSSPKYKNVVVYRFEADVTNNTDKFITDAQIKSKLKLIFEEKTIIGANTSTSFSNSISKSNPWGPSEKKVISIKTKDIDKVYLNYKPPYVIFEINMVAEDPIGYKYDKNIWEVNLTNKWNVFTEGFKQKNIE